MKKRPPFVCFLRGLGMGILGLIVFAGFAFLFGLFVMFLWNWLMPAIFGLGLITFWQAFGLVILGRLLIGGFPRPPHHGHKPWGRDKCNPKHEDWKKWKYYGQFWKDEGETAFQNYIDKKENAGGEEPKS